ncbi:MAG: divergent polysaccharide deacetylase family protein [Elusimicrobia bacterium]|nr:divergent polysaccharide deacetylase family protein [Elusimicrobiota bacterium]
MKTSLLAALAFLSVPAFAAPSEPAPKPAAPRLAVVIDDFGLTYPKDQPDSDWMDLKFPITFAVMPVSPRTTKAAEAARAAGHEVIIHYPFDKYQKLELAKDSVTPADWKSVTALFEKAVKQVPGAVGLNNHQSYRGTMNRPMMAKFMPLIKEKGWYFLDSHVSPKSVAYDEARKAGVPAAVNGIFLDGAHEAKARKKAPEVLEAAIARDEKVCVHWLRYSAAEARKKGSAVAIGHHYYHGTYRCLVHEVPKLQAEGVEFVFASAVAK